MTVMISSPLASSSTCDSIATRLRVMLGDVEKQIQTHISEQRACGPLRLADDDGRTPSAAAGRPRPVTVANRLAVVHRSYPHPRRAWRQRPTAQDHLLGAIFDTPECRTELAPAQAWSCQLRRRGATFHRVEQSVVEATERRIRQWNQAVVSPSPSYNPDSPTIPSAEDAPEPWMTAGKPDEPSDPAELLELGTTPQIKRPDRKLELTPENLTAWFASRETPAVMEDRNLRHYGHGYASRWSPPLSPLSFDMPSPSHSLYACSLHKSGNRRTNDTLPYHAPESTTSEPSLVSSSDGEQLSESVPTPAHGTRSEEFCEQQGALKSAADPRADHHQISPPAGQQTEQDAEQQQILKPSEQEAEKPQAQRQAVKEAKRPLVSRKAERPVSLARTTSRRQVKEAKTSKWLPIGTTPLTSVKRMRSVSRRARREANRRNKRAAAKAKVFGDNVAEILSGRAFQRPEVQEMIDTNEISAWSSSDDSRSRSSSIHEAQNGSSSSSERYLPIEGHRESEVPSRLKLSRLQEISTATTNHDTSSLSQQQQPPEQQHSSFSREFLPPIPEVSPIQDRDNAALFAGASVIISPLESAPGGTSIRSGHSRHTLPASFQPFSNHRPSQILGAAPSKHRRRATASDDVDWTAFQMAISGPTGDYLMAGDAHSESGSVDDLVDWFLEYGFDSEGVLIQSDEMEDPERLLDCPPKPPTPVQPSAAAELGPSGPAKTGPDEAWKMSCNLQDLGEYLNFESYHVGAYLI